MRSLMIVLLSLYACTAMAQFAVTPNPAYASGPIKSSFSRTTMFKNTSGPGGNSSFTWVRVQNLPAGWATQICDPITCWDKTVDSSTFTLQPGDSNILYVLFVPDSISGNTLVKLFVYPINDRSQGDTVYYYGATWPVAVQQVDVSQAFGIYPNPTQDVLHVRYETAEPVRVHIFDLLGRQVKSIAHNGSVSDIHVGDLPQGTYIIRMDDHGRVTGRIFMRN